MRPRRLHLKLLTATFTSKTLDCGLGTLRGGVLPTAINVICAETINAPTLYLDRRLAVGATGVKHIVAALCVLFASMSLEVFMGSALDYSTASTIA
jgi:hypothetical protein